MTKEKILEIIKDNGWEIDPFDESYMELVNSTSTVSYEFRVSVDLDDAGCGFAEQVVNALNDFDAAEFAYDLINQGDMPDLDEMQDIVSAGKEAETLCALLRDIISELVEKEAWKLWQEGICFFARKILTRLIRVRTKLTCMTR